MSLVGFGDAGCQLGEWETNSKLCPMTTMPTWEGFMIPTLQVMSDGAVRSKRELCPLVADQLDLSPDQRNELLDSGQARYENRIGWGLSLMANVGLLERPARGRYRATDVGLRILSEYPDGITERELDRLASEPASGVRKYSATPRMKAGEVSSTASQDDERTPIEQVQAGIDRITAEVADELLSRLQEEDPAFFEQAVVDLLLGMGYGGTYGAGRVTQLTNDGGIDGVIDQDILGISRVYVQAKRYASGNSVGRPELQAFVGALSGKADSGVFITTSEFSKAAQDYANGIPTRIILVDGTRLTKLMIRFGVGVQVKQTFNVVAIDEDFFA